LTQEQIHKGFNVFGEVGTAFVLEKLQQLHKRGMIELQVAY